VLSEVNDMKIKFIGWLESKNSLKHPLKYQSRIKLIISAYRAVS